MIDFKKFEKYSKPGPRYTSYPTAPEFNTSFTKEKLIQKLQNDDENKPLSLYIHIPFCRSACYFCGCNVIYTSKDEKKIRYIKYLKKELKILSRYLNTKRLVTQMHFGGGTPTFLSPSELNEVIVEIKKTFPNFAQNAEISCEVDPRFFTKEHMQVLKDGGTNRISFGVQDFNELVQQTIHRIQPYELTKNVIQIARDANIDSINIDLIYGLPHQNKQTFHQTLLKVLQLNPDRVATFNYAHVPWLIKTQRKFDENTFAPPSEKLEILKDIIDTFTNNGYKMVGMDHFAKPDDELFKAIEKNELHRNFQGYTTKGGATLIGIGVTSIGEGNDWYVQNYKDLKEYENTIDNDELPVFRGIELNEDDKIRKEVIMSLMSNFKLDIKKIESQFNINFYDYFHNSLELLQEFVDANLITINNNEIKANQTGTMLIRNISMVFDAYLQKIPENQRRFSKTI